jgi:hypothetical protein
LKINQNVRYLGDDVEKVFTDFPPETERADNPVVKEPNRTCSPMAMFKVHPVNLAFAEDLSFSMIAWSRVGCRRSATVRPPPRLFNKFSAIQVRNKNVTHFCILGYYPINRVKVVGKLFFVICFGFSSSGIRIRWQASRRLYGLTETIAVAP